MSDSEVRRTRGFRARSGGDRAATGVASTPSRRMSDPVVREFLLTFWKIHILHHAEEERGVYGMWMIEELNRHGYRLSPGTIYPILTRMAQRGWIKAVEPKSSRDARVYRITSAGADVLDRLRQALGELGGEVGRRPRSTARRTAGATPAGTPTGRHAPVSRSRRTR